MLVIILVTEPMPLNSPDKKDSSFVKRAPFALLLLFVAAVSVRLLPLKQVVNGDELYLYDGDCYLHLRKILLHLAEFPRFVTFDYYEGFPAGTTSLKPLMLDYFMALVCKVAGLGLSDTRAVEITTAVIPAIIGGLTVLAVYYLAKSLFDGETGIIAALIITFMPSHIHATIIGRPDNEMMEPLMDKGIIIDNIMDILYFQHCLGRNIHRSPDFLN